MGNAQGQLKVAGTPVGAYQDPRREIIIAVTKTNLQYYQTESKVLLKTVNVSSFSKSNITTSCYSDDDDIIITGDSDFRIRQYHGNSGDFISTIPIFDDQSGSHKSSHDDVIRSLCVLPYDRLLSGGNDGVMKLWKRKTQELICSFKNTSAPASFSSTPGANNNNNNNNSSSNNNNSNNTQQQQQSTSSSSSSEATPITALAYDVKRNYVFCGGSDGVVRAFSPDSADQISLRTPICEMRGHRGAIMAMVVANVADVLVTSCMDGSIRLWDMASGKEVGGAKYYAQCMQYDRLRDILFCGNGDGQFAAIQVLNAGLMKGEIRKLRTAEMHRNGIQSLFYNTVTDSLVTTCTSDSTVGVCSAVTGVTFDDAIATNTNSSIYGNGGAGAGGGGGGGSHRSSRGYVYRGGEYIEQQQHQQQQTNSNSNNNSGVESSYESSHYDGAGAGGSSGVEETRSRSESVEDLPFITDELVEGLLAELKISHDAQNATVPPASSGTDGSSAATDDASSPSATTATSNGPLPITTPADVALANEERLLQLCLRLFGEGDDRKEKLVTWFGQMRVSLQSQIASSHMQLVGERTNLYDQRWIVIEPDLGMQQLEKTIEGRLDDLREQHRRELAELEERANRERLMFRERVPSERKKVAATYKDLIERHNAQAKEIHHSVSSSVRGVLASSFPILLNRYQVGGLLPNASSVFRGLDLQTSNQVAVKAFPGAVASSLSTSLSHPHLVKVLDLRSEEEKDAIYVIMEMMDKNLLSYSHLWTSSSSSSTADIPTSTIRSVITSVVSCLQYLHGQSLVARELRPSTILMKTNNMQSSSSSSASPSDAVSPTTNLTTSSPLDINHYTVKLQHLGIMKALLGTLASEQPDDKIVFSAPELFLRAVSTASDMWSVGCVVLYLMQTHDERTTPFISGTDAASVLQSVLSFVGVPAAGTLKEIASEMQMTEESASLLLSLSSTITTTSSSSSSPSSPSLSPSSTNSNALLRENARKKCSRLSREPKALDFLVQLLVFDPRRRMSAASALAHPFLKDKDTSAAVAVAGAGVADGFSTNNNNDDGEGQTDEVY